MPGAGHAIRHHRTQQGLNGAKHGNGESRPEQRLDQLEVHRQRLAIRAGQRPRRHQSGRNGWDPGATLATRLPGETRGDGVHPRTTGKPVVHHIGRCRPGNQSHQGRGHRQLEARPQQQHRKRQNPNPQLNGIKARQRRQYPPQVGQEMLAHANTEPQKVRNLKHCDYHGNTGSKPQNHRIGNELDQPPKPGHAKSYQDRAGHHGGDEKPTQPMFLNNGEEDHHKSGGRAGHIEARAPGQGDQRPSNNRRIKTVLGRHTRGNRQRHGQRHSHGANGQPRHHIVPQIGKAITLRPGSTQASGDAGNMPHLFVLFVLAGDCRACGVVHTMAGEIIPDQLAHNLGGSQVLGRAQVLKRPLLFRIHQNGEARRLRFHNRLPASSIHIVL